MKLGYRNLKTKSTFPFLELPREIRDLIYEMLLTTPYTFTYTASLTANCLSRPFFTQSTAILLTNKQISAEAQEIFYARNEFICLRFVGRTPQYLAKHSSFSDLPAFPPCPRRDLLDPVLTVTIEILSDDREDDDNGQFYTLLTTVEAIDNILEGVWDCMMDKSPSFDERLTVALEFQNKNPLRRQFLHEHILKPWDQLWAFKDITLEGDIDNDLLAHLAAYMESGLHSSDILRYLELYQRKAETYQKRKLYHHAAWCWNHLHRYWLYNHHATHLVNTETWETLYTFSGNLTCALKSTQPIILRMTLEMMKISFHLRDYHRAERYVRNGLDQIMYPPLGLSGIDERELYLVKAGLFLCRTVVNVECGDHTSAFKYLNSAARDFVNSNTRHHMDLTDIKDKLCWAIDKYFIDVGLPDRRCMGKKWLVSENHTDTKVSREGWPTLWEWLDPTEVLRTEDEWEDIP
jgi:hypothetical protein